MGNSELYQIFSMPFNNLTNLKELKGLELININAQFAVLG